MRAAVHAMSCETRQASSGGGHAQRDEACACPTMPERRDEESNLDPFFRARLAGLSEGSPLPAGFLDPANDWEPPELIDIEDVLVPCQAGGVPCRVYSPRTKPPRRALLWLHGGGFVDGTIEWGEAHAVAAELCARTDTLVVSVEYRLVTDHVKFPAPLEDVLRAWNWLRSHAASEDEDLPLFVGGASAGANLAAGLAMLLRDHAEEVPEGMLLAYGVFHKTLPVLGDDDSKLAVLPRVLRFTQADHDTSLVNYVGRDGSVPAYVTPGDVDLAGMPPAALIACEFDDLAASSLAFAQQLQAAGVDVSLHRAPGMLHGHFNWYPGPVLPETERSLSFLADWLLGDEFTTSPHHSSV